MNYVLYPLIFVCYVAGVATAWFYGMLLLPTQKQQRLLRYGLVLHLLALVVIVSLIFSSLFRR